MKAFVLVISSLLLAAPASAQGSGTAQDRAPSADTVSSNASSARADAADERVICRRVETNTGSRVPFRRLCLTEAQWEVWRRQND